MRGRFKPGDTVKGATDTSNDVSVKLRHRL